MPSKSFEQRVRDAGKDRVTRRAAAATAASRTLHLAGERRTESLERTRATTILAGKLAKNFAPERSRHVIGQADTANMSLQYGIIPTVFRSKVGHYEEELDQQAGWILSEQSRFGTTTAADVEPFGQPTAGTVGLLLTTEGKVVTYSSYKTDPRHPDQLLFPYEVVEYANPTFDPKVHGISPDGTLSIGSTDPTIRGRVDQTVVSHCADQQRADLDSLLANLAARYGIDPAVFT